MKRFLCALKICAATALFLAIVGCQVMDRAPQSLTMSTMTGPRPQQFIIIGADQYEGELAFALAELGFKVKPIAITAGVRETIEPGKVIEYVQAGFRYALKLTIAHDPGFRCTFSGGHRVAVTMAVVDIQSNESLALIRQSGPDRECPPLTPVWPLLAKELARMWR